MKTELILILFAGIMSISMTAFAQTDEVDVGFEWGYKNCVESTVATAEGSVQRLNCSWLGLVPEGATIIEDTEGNIEIVIEEDAETETEISDEATILKEVPVMKPEQLAKVEGIISAKEVIEDYGSGEKSVEELCFGGTERENRIFQEFETIDVKSPNDNTPLGTNIQFKYEHLLSEICKAEYTLLYKVHNALRTLPGEGESYIFVPRTDFEGLIWDELEGLEDPTYAFQERHMTDLNMQTSELTAEGFQCSIPGKQQGHCIKSESEQPIPKPTISSEGKKALNDYWILRETGEADIPKQDPDAEPLDRNSITRQYLESLGWTTSQIDAAIEAMESEN